MGYRLGIDLGTTFTAAAADTGDGPRMVGLGNRALQVPSVLFLLEDGAFLCAEAAERRAATQPDRVVREFKRRFGDTVPMLVAGQPFSPQALTARLLSWVVATATEREGRAPDEVVLTHPANWGGFKRELFAQVATLADLQTVVSACTEPEAAALQYSSRADLAVGDRVVVYDLGGGTFDVCVLAMSEQGCEILGTPDGVEHLGGVDFDEAVFRHVLGAVADQVAELSPDDPVVTEALNQVRRDCVEAKEALSNDVDTVVPVRLPGVSTSVRLTRSELEELIAPSIHETLAATRRALRSAQTETQDLAAVVLVGGSSRIPLVSQLLQSELGVRTAMDTHPKHDIALGSLHQGLRHQGADTPAPAHPAPVATPAAPMPSAPTASASAAAAAPEVVFPTRGVPEPASGRTAEPTAEPAEPIGPTAPAATITGPPPDVAPRPRDRPKPPRAPRPSRDLRVSPRLWGAAAALLLVLGGAGAVWLVAFGDDEPTTSTTGAGGTESPSPESRTSIAVSELVVERERPAGSAELVIVSADGGPVKPLVARDGQARVVPAISPDRRFVYYRQGGPGEEVRSYDNVVLDLETNEVLPMVPTTEEEEKGLDCVGRPGWLPGEPTTATVLCRSDSDEAVLAYEARTADNGQLVDLDQVEALPPRLVNVSYVQSGAFVTTERGSEGQPGIHVRAGEGDGEWLVSGEVGNASGSPFDDRIVYEQEGRLHIVNADGSDPDCPGPGVLQPDPRTPSQSCVLTGEEGFDFKPAWSQEIEGAAPTRLVFVRAAAEKAPGRLMVLDLATGEAQPFSPVVRRATDPAWAHR